MVHERKGQEGFALIAALLVFWILTALGMLVFSVTTQDLRVSSRTVGERKAFSGAESGLNYLIQNFDAANSKNYTTSSDGSVVDATDGDPNTRYAIQAATNPASGPAGVPIPGYAIGGGETWGRQRYTVSVKGMNTAYKSTMQINVGVGYGPVDISTVYR